MASDPRRSPDRIVLDTNVLALALAFGGVPESILELGRGGLVRLFASSFILGELARVLAGIVLEKMGRSNVCSLTAKVGC